MRGGDVEAEVLLESGQQPHQRKKPVAWYGTLSEDPAANRHLADANLAGNLCRAPPGVRGGSGQGLIQLHGPSIHRCSPRCQHPCWVLGTKMTSMSEAPYEMLSRLQAEAGIKDTELAAILGVKEIQVARYKDGRTQLTRMRTDRFLTLCRKLKVSPWRLAGQTEPGTADVRGDAETEAPRLEVRLQRIEQDVADLRRALMKPPHEAGGVEGRAIEALAELERASEQSSTEESEIGDAQ